MLFHTAAPIKLYVLTNSLQLNDERCKPKG